MPGQIAQSRFCFAPNIRWGTPVPTSFCHFSYPSCTLLVEQVHPDHDDFLVPILGHYSFLIETLETTREKKKHKWSSSREIGNIQGDKLGE